MIGAGSYILSAAALAAVVLSIGFSAVRLRQRLLPTWEGAPARLVEAILGIALLIWLSQILGTVGLFYAWTLTSFSLLLAAVCALALPSAGGRGGGGSRTYTSPAVPPSPPDRTRSGAVTSLVALAVVALVFAHWGLTTKSALDRGIFNFDSLWYHMPTAASIAESHSVTGIVHTETVFTTWFYPQNSELLHAVGILFTHRDTLSLFLNFGWLAIAFLAAWCIGRPYGRGPLSVVAVAIVLECHTLVVREPGAAKNDLATAAPLLAAIAILITAWSMRRTDSDSQPPQASAVPLPRIAGQRNSGAASRAGELPVGWPLAAAGLAVGLAAGTKFTALGMAAALSLAVIVLAPTGRRWAAAAWWFLPAFAAGGFWYLRNLVVAGNPLPMVERLGPIELPHPEGLSTLRPDYSIAHYATDTGIWSDYFGPGLDRAFGALWPLVIAAAILGALLAVVRGRDQIVRWMGGVALFGMVAYVFMPLSAAGAEGVPDAFAINVRYVVPAMLVALALLPLPSFSPLQWGKTWERVLLVLLLAVLLVSNRSDAVLRDPDRIFAVLLAVVLVLIPAGLLYARSRGAPLAAVCAGFAALALAILAIGYPLQRDYLDDRFANRVADTSIPGMGLDSAYRWARGVEDARIGLAGTTAGFLQYGFYGTDLSNEVRYLGAEGPHGAFTPIPTCREFRAAVNAADLDYLITAPFLNFIHTDHPIPSPEAGWLRNDPAVTPIRRQASAVPHPHIVGMRNSGAEGVTVWRVRGRLDPAACGPANAPLRRIPNAPSS